ncbi:hypothetical protein P3557_08140, partial [Vibrio parahaemolyticus]|nr:hypothetical protein [Vibrio parahaemolyticus]
MMRLYCVIATAMLMPLTAQATVYDVAKPSELNQICSTHSSFDIQRTDTTFFCHGKIVLPAGDSIISSSPENEVILVPFPFNSDRLSYQSNGSSFTSIAT